MLNGVGTKDNLVSTRNDISTRKAIHTRVTSLQTI